MNEIKTGDVTVMVLTNEERDSLGEVLGHVTRYNAGPWGDALSNLRSVLDALDIPIRDNPYTVNPHNDDLEIDDLLDSFVDLQWLCQRARFGKHGYRTLMRQGLTPQAYKMGRKLYFRRDEVETWLRTVRLVKQEG